jgi:hypothetical protein
MTISGQPGQADGSLLRPNCPVVSQNHAYNISQVIGMID